ncbi:hypothetical protein [Amycolatopsis alkalitolerans]|uniref:Uncharacterized protein n=1 Tax=Amycolatopsis alkalitolerans TaxID=2547244 RepID=A0A5C4LTJ1_9PSEU|nr:hypothetical protein [Amycolatopsis alkalitolerans]TNC22398.1 hypothetical protein FG385_25720 [Amycolatopsis alkalitolerans]
MECPSCVSELDHCHGTLVRHEDELVECTEPGCRDLDLVRHTLSVSCAEIDGGCHCTVTFVEQYAQAS